MNSWFVSHNLRCLNFLHLSKFDIFDGLKSFHLGCSLNLHKGWQFLIGVIIGLMVVAGTWYLRESNLWAWPSAQWQWGISALLALMALIVPFLIPEKPSTHNQISGGTFHAPVSVGGTQNNTVHTPIDEKAAQLIAEQLAAHSQNVVSEDLQNKENEIKSLKETIIRLEQDAPGNACKQDALEYLAGGEAEKASSLLKKCIAERSFARKQLEKQEAQDWVDVGNIAFLHNTQEALAAYQKAVELDADNIDAWNRLGHIYKRLGKLDDAIQSYETVQSLAGDNQEHQAVAYGNLGLIYQIRGELDKAEEFLLKSLDIEKALGWQEGMASDYGNLGLIYQIRGELDKAEEFLLKSLKINESLGRQEGMASDYGNLGLIYRTRGELDKAEEFHLKSLDIEKALERQEGMASDYGNLGLIYRTRGELDKAEEFLLKSLKINEALGRQQGMAAQYGNLGLIYRTRGELDKAEEFHLKALKIDEALGRQVGMANQYGNLGLIYRTRGELDKAEEFHLKALKIDEALGRQEGMANQYGNLGLIYQQRGDMNTACQHWQISVAIFNEMGAASAKKAQQLIDENCQ